MLQEYGICMCLVRSTSAALCICDMMDSCHSDRQSEESTPEDGRGDKRAAGKRLSTNDVGGILCYICYLPLFIAGPLMTYENFRLQVSAT